MVENFTKRIMSGRRSGSFKNPPSGRLLKGFDDSRTYIVKKSDPESDIPYAKYFPSLEKAEVAK